MTYGDERSPAGKFALAIGIALALALPIFAIWFLVYDRQSQSNEARQSITAGWGDAQVISGPALVIPYRATATETVVENGKSVTRSREVLRELIVSPLRSKLETHIAPEVRRRSIYEAVVYEARVAGTAGFTLPPELARAGIDPATLDLSRAELRFGLSDPRGLGANPRVSAGGRPVALQPGQGSSGNKGFFSWIDASSIRTRPLIVDYAFNFRGNASLELMPAAGQTDWTLRSAWPHPSFGGQFLPDSRRVDDGGFSARYTIGNLALGQSLFRTALPGEDPKREREMNGPGAGGGAQVSLIQPVDLYSKVDRAAKYGFLFIAFTFLALLMFDIIGGAAVSAIEYLLMGAALVLFFVLLLAFAEVIGFTPAYLLAAGAITGLNTAYSAAILKSWRRAAFIGGLLVGLYAALYILLSLEAYSLLIGSLLLFAALAGVMYATRNIEWSGRSPDAKAA